MPININTFFSFKVFRNGTNSLIFHSEDLKSNFYAFKKMIDKWNKIFISEISDKYHVCINRIRMWAPLQFLDWSAEHDNLAYSAAYLVTKRKIYFRKRLVERFRDRNGQNARLRKMQWSFFQHNSVTRNYFTFYTVIASRKTQMIWFRYKKIDQQRIQISEKLM